MAALTFTLSLLVLNIVMLNVEQDSSPFWKGWYIGSIAAMGFIAGMQFKGLF